MLTKEIKFTDFNGNERTKVCYFNLSKGDLIKMQATGWQERMELAATSTDNKLIFDTFTELIKMSYGEKSDDGESFMKSEEMSNKFLQSAMYDELITELLSDDKAAINFFRSIMPAEIQASINDENMADVVKKVTKKTTKKTTK